MKKLKQRLLSMILVVLMVVGILPVQQMATVEAAMPTTLYLDANDNVWKTDNAWFAAYFYTDANNYEWVKGEEKSDTGYYEFEIISGKTYTSVIFCRMNHAETELSWDSKWNQTADLTIQTDGKNLYKITGWLGDKGDGYWDTYSESSTDDDIPTTETKRIYFDTTKYLGTSGTASGWESAYAYIWTDGVDGSGTTVTMTPVEGKAGFFYYDVPSSYTNIIFRPNENDWKGQTQSQTIPSDKNLFTCTSFGATTAGTWGTYTTTDTGNNFPSNVTGKVTFFDLYTDTEIKGSTEYYGLENWTYRVYNGNSYTDTSASAGRNFTSIGRAFSNNANVAISNYWNSKNSSVYPLYFGNFQPFYMVQPSTIDANSVFCIDPWWISSNNYKDSSNNFSRTLYMKDIYNSMRNFSWFLNRSIDVNKTGEDQAKYGAVVQGLVGSKLNSEGNIVANGTSVVLPQFSAEFYKNNPSVGKVYDTMEFPFVVRQINGANYYQFDSGVNGSTNRDVIRMNDEKSGLIYYNGNTDSTQVVYGIKADGTRTPGFFPFNGPEDSPPNTSYDNENNKLNYGFGMKLEIEFTMDSDGTVKNLAGGNIPAIFEFSGDDDVWIYVDGKLALDLGGSHGVAEGKLDFSTNTATVQYVKTVKGSSNDTASEAISVENSYEHKDYINSMANEAGVNVNKTSNFTIDKSDATKIHTLTIFYEERGMFESNFKATFNLEQPTVLKTTNTVNVNNVNSALQSVTAGVAANEAFTFEINDANSADVTGKTYTTEDGTATTFNGTMTLGNGDSATFTKQFDRASELELIQTANNRYDTSWTMSELSDSDLGDTIAASYQNGKNSLVTGDGRVTGEEASAFKLENADNGADQDVPAKVQVDYVQNPKTGGIAIMKTMADGTTSDTIFEFTVTLSNIFGGGSAEATYDLIYDVYSYGGEGSKIVRKNATATNGVVQLKAGQFALISGIPVETNYKVVENTKAGYSLENLDAKTNISNDTNLTSTISTGTVTGTVVADTSSNVDMFVYTNDIVTLKDSFLVEVGKENTLNVIPSTSNDGTTLSDDLKGISDAWNNWPSSTGNTEAGFVFIVNGEPYVDDNDKPIKELTIDGVTYTVTEDEDGNPVIAVTPGEDAVTDKDSISVKYQLVEVYKESGAVKFNTQEDPDDPSKTIEEVANITGVITMKNYLYKANDDIYVLDYGLDVDLAQKTGDGLFENDSLANPELTGTTSTYWNTANGANGSTATASTKVDQNTDPATDTYGTITPASNTTTGYGISSEGNPTITYSLNKFLEGKDYFNYGVMIQKADANVDGGQTSNRFRLNVTSDICIMPAEVVYYEDNFNSEEDKNDSTVKIVYSGDADDIQKEGTSLTLTQSNGQSEQYGHDEAYASGTTDSAGSSTALTADGYNTKAIFTFKGTGFDVVGRTTTTSAGIIYTVEQQTGTDVDGNATWTLFKTGAVDTYYANGDLYQIPVIHEDLETYGTYRVTLGIKATGTDDPETEENEQNVTFYLDGIRIYNTLGTDGDEAYIDDEEGVTFVKVGDLILGDGDIVETGIVGEDGKEITGQVINGSQAALLYNVYREPEEGEDEENFVPEVIGFEALGYTKTEDTNGGSGDSNRTTSILQYMHSGPNNEIYLDDTASIAFIVVPEEGKTPTIQIEAKLVNIDGVVDKKPETDGVDLNVWNGSGLTKVDDIASATAMYYPIDLTDCQKLSNGNYLVVISGNSDNYTSSISFSNLKYKDCELVNPLDEEYTAFVGDIIDTSFLIGSEDFKPVFVSLEGEYKIVKNTKITNKYSIELTEDVFNGNEPKFTMYYVNNEVRKEITVTAARDTTQKDAYVYKITFKAPNAVGTFPIEIHYVVDDEESTEYLATTMKVYRR